MIEKLAYGFLALLLGGMIVWLLTERSKWQGMYYSGQYALDAANDRATDAEREAQSYQERLAFNDQFLKTLLNKPVIAALNDSQMMGLVQHCVAAIASAKTPKEEMN